MEFFCFPSQYRNYKQFGKERYLKYANLTEREYQFLKKNLIDIQVEYQLPCRDGIQVMIFSVEVNTLRSLGLSEMCAILSRSSWRPSLYLLWMGNTGKICTAIKEPGKDGRGRVISQVSTRLFDLRAPEAYVTNVLMHLNVPFQDYTSEQLIREWYHAIDLVAGWRADNIIELDGGVYRINNPEPPAEDDDAVSIQANFSDWYEDLKTSFCGNKSEELFSELENEELLIEDFISIAKEVLLHYLRIRSSGSFIQPDMEIDPEDELVFDEDEALLEQMAEGELIRWKQEYLEACFRYTYDTMHAVLSLRALGELFESLRESPEEWSTAMSSVVDIDTVEMYMERG